MATSIDQAFIKQFEREVHEAYQRQGSKLRNTVRTINNVVGSEAVFQKVGKGLANIKASHGMVPVMGISHDSTTCVLTDYYAGDWIDRLDEMKTNIDERQVIANAGAYAMGRKSDNLIIEKLATVTDNQKIESGGTGLTLEKIMEALGMLGENDVPDDGQRFAVIGWRQWGELLSIDEFSNSDYVGSDALPFMAPTQAKYWLGTYWIPHSGLPLDEDDIRSCFWYHKSAVGHASASDVITDITWHGDRASHFVNNMMSQGACLIDHDGVVEILCNENHSG